MKTKNILLILFLCCTSICFAQNKLFDKYSEMDNVTESHSYFIPEPIGCHGW